MDSWHTRTVYTTYVPINARIYTHSRKPAYNACMYEYTVHVRMYADEHMTRAILIYTFIPYTCIHARTHATRTGCVLACVHRRTHTSMQWLCACIHMSTRTHTSQCHTLGVPTHMPVFAHIHTCAHTQTPHASATCSVYFRTNFDPLVIQKLRNYWNPEKLCYAEKLSKIFPPTPVMRFKVCERPLIIMKFTCTRIKPFVTTPSEKTHSIRVGTRSQGISSVTRRYFDPSSLFMSSFCCVTLAKALRRISHSFTLHLELTYQNNKRAQTTHIYTHLNARHIRVVSL